MKIKIILLSFILSFCFVPLSMAQGDSKAFENFKSIPILHEGRIKPLDTYARNLLIQFSSKDSYDHKDAVLWLAKLLFTPERTSDDKIFLINNPEIATALNIKAEEHRRYSFGELKNVLPKMFAACEMAFSFSISGNFLLSMTACSILSQSRDNSPLSSIKTRFFILWDSMKMKVRCVKIS